MVLIKLKSINQRKKIIRKKKTLKNRREKIQDDLTWDERRMQRKLKEIVETIKKKGEENIDKNERIMIEK